MEINDSVFKTQSTSRMMQLESELQNLKQGGDESLNKYVATRRQLWQGLKPTGNKPAPVDLRSCHSRLALAMYFAVATYFAGGSSSPLLHVCFDVLVPTDAPIARTDRPMLKTRLG